MVANTFESFAQQNRGHIRGRPSLSSIGKTLIDADRYLYFSSQHRQTQRSIRQRYASSIKRHRLGAIEEEGEEEPQEDLNSNKESVDALSEVVIENKPTIAKERAKLAEDRRGNIEMRSHSRSLDRNANKLEVGCIYYMAEINAAA